MLGRGLGLGLGTVSRSRGLTGDARPEQVGYVTKAVEEGGESVGKEAEKEKEVPPHERVEKEGSDRASPQSMRKRQLPDKFSMKGKVRHVFFFLIPDIWSLRLVIMVDWRVLCVV
jgi:hypothetical protein